MAQISKREYQPYTFHMCWYVRRTEPGIDPSPTRTDHSNMNRTIQTPTPQDADEARKAGQPAKSLAVVCGRGLQRLGRRRHQPPGSESQYRRLLRRPACGPGGFEVMV